MTADQKYDLFNRAFKNLMEHRMSFIESFDQEDTWRRQGDELQGFCLVMQKIQEGKTRD